MSDFQPVRAPRAVDLEQPRPVYVVWEITLACNLKCRHCGSRAGAQRRNELTTDECLALIDDLHRLGTREITLIGGEAYLRSDWLALIEAIACKGMLCGLQTGARALTPEKIAAAARAGLRSAGVSIDGLREVHDDLRGVPGSFDMAIAALRLFRMHGLSGSVNTQINTRNIGQLPELMDVIVEAGATGWQLQLTVPMGRAADDAALILQPYRLLELMPLLAGLVVEGRRRGLHLIPGNNVGYFGPYEAFWRSISGKIEYYGGCNAGRNGLGIEADGSIKGCPSLPSKDYVGGNIRTTPLADLWHDSQLVGFSRDKRQNSARLWGYCRTCYYSSECQGGCTWSAHVVSGRPGNNPFCHYRALKLAERGLRECIEHRAAPAGKPFDYGMFDILVEDENGNRFPQSIFDADNVAASPSQVGRPPGELIVCGACEQLAYPGSETCPHCGADSHRLLSSGRQPNEAAIEAARAQIERLRTLSVIAHDTLQRISAHAESIPDFESVAHSP
ncbi:MAG: radical SAM protein [Pseudorhodoplanes sp.]|nr:radical SAM protein [Pseudorhodoplanes sp.]